MSESDRIRLFLRSVRRRVLLEAGLRAGGLTAAAVLAALLVLALLAVRIGPASFWPRLTAILGAAVLLGGLALWLAPVRRLRSERALAVLVGRRHPPLASDLLSAVELEVPEGAPLPHGGSPGMARAFQAAVAEAVTPLDPRRLVPLSRAGRAWLTVLGAAALLAAGLTLAPATVRRGLAILVRHPTRFEGAAVAREPLVGDVKITYSFPAYTGLPRRTVEGSTGDVVGLKGTDVVIETRLLRSARKALLLLGDAGEGGEIEARIEGGRLHASLRLADSGSYRVWLAPLIGRPVREQRAHRIVVEADRPPEVDIIGPADRLELPAPRPIEVGYQARDDFGLGAVDLVFRVDDGPEQRQALRDAAGARSAQDKVLFDPSQAALAAGSRVSYRIEARDRDAISGAKAGSSRTLYLVIQNPRENLDEQLARQRDILDKLLLTLADRLELGEGTSASTPPAAANALGQLSVWLSVHEGEESHVALLGRLVDEERRTGTASKSLVAALASIADRLGKHLRDEAGLLAALRAKADQGALTLSAFARIQAAGGKHVEELESAVLLLDDLIGRQRLEDLAALGRELTSAYKRLQDLAQRYAATQDEALRRQLEREIRDLRSRIEELARKIAEVKARNEVPTEWQNMPDLKEAMSKAQQLDSLIDKGDPKSMQEALAELGSTLESLQKMLEQNADEFGGARFAGENRAANDVMKKLGDLEGDQRAVASDSKALAGEMDAELQRRLQGQLEQFLAGAKEKLEALRKKVGTPAPREAGEIAEDEQRRAQESVKQLRRLLPAKEWGEARKELERTGGSLKRLRRMLEDRQAARRASSPPLESFSGEMSEAARIAQELQGELDKLLPRPDETMSPGQRDRARGLSDREGNLGQRTREVADELGRKSGQIPGADKAEGELRQIAEQMGDASQQMGRGAAKEAAEKAQEAADRLAKLRDGMSRRQMGRGTNQREPVRIPGADEYKAPREWRQELMEAMREKAPERFREEVRRYYEELVK